MVPTRSGTSDRPTFACPSETKRTGPAVGECDAGWHLISQIINLPRYIDLHCPCDMYHPDMKITDASHLTDAELARELGRLVGHERQATLALIIHLAEFDARRLYEPAGFRSLFAYCRTVLQLSEDAIFNRIETARAARRFPEIVDMLADGRLSPTTVRMLAPRLTEANHQQLLSEAAGMGKREVEELRARHFPQPDVPPRVRKLTDPAAADEPSDRGTLFDGPVSSESAARTGVTMVSAPAATASAAPTLPPERRRPLVRPLAPHRYAIRFTADADTRKLLQQAQ